MMGYGNGMTGMGWGWLFGALLLVGTVLVVLALVRHFAAPAHPTAAALAPNAADRRSSAADVLDARYAAGEIDTTEYLERRRHLATP